MLQGCGLKGRVSGVGRGRGHGRGPAVKVINGTDGSVAVRWVRARALPEVSGTARRAPGEFPDLSLRHTFLAITFLYLSNCE